MEELEEILIFLKDNLIKEDREYEILSYVGANEPPIKVVKLGKYLLSHEKDLIIGAIVNEIKKRLER